MHYLPCLLHHLPLFLGIGVIQEDIYLRQYIKGYLVGINVGDGVLSLQHLPGLFGKLLNGGGAGARYRLVGNGHDALYGIDPVQRVERHHHLDGGAVRIGDNPLMSLNVLRVDLGHYQRHLGFHTEGRAIINHYRPGLGG
ncbi:hypothetical protein ES708_32177 [subsurface metagenome]